MKTKFGPIPVLAAFIAVSCSLPGKLPEGAFRLVRNDVKVSGSLPASEISPYIKQQPNSYLVFDFNPFKPPVVYDSSLSESSKENISNHLANLGYYHPRIEISERYKRRKVKVTYRVFPGETIPITSLNYSFPEGDAFREDFMADTLNSLIKTGKPVSESLLEKEVARCVSVMKNKGYYSFSKANFEFVADTLSKNGTATLEYRIKSDTPIERHTFGKVSFSRPENMKFRDRVFSRFNTIHSGDTYSETTVANTYSRLSQLRAFNTVNISTQASEGNKVDCDVRLSSSDIQGFKVNLEGSFTSTGLLGVSPNISYFHKNIFGGSEWLNLGFSGDFQTRPGTSTRATEFTASASLSFPYPHLRMEVGAAFNYQDRPEFVRNIYSGNYGFTGRLSEKLLYQVNVLQVNAVYLRSISDKFLEILAQNPMLVYSYSNHYDSGIGGSLYWTTNTDIVPKTSYQSLRLSFDTAGNFLGLFKNVLPKNSKGEGMVFSLPYSQYVKAEVMAVKNIRMERHSVAFRANVGAAFAYGNSTSMPYEKQFYVGGASSMRGWQARSVGPGDSEYISKFSIPSQTGDFKIEVDAEYRFPLFWKMEGAAFLEAGNVWNMSEMNIDFYTQFAADWGLGIRLNFDFLVLRLDCGFKLHDPSKTGEARWLGVKDWFRKDGFALHFGVGYPF